MTVVVISVLAQLNSHLISIYVLRLYTSEIGEDTLDIYATKGNTTLPASTNFAITSPTQYSRKSRRGVAKQRYTEDQGADHHHAPPTVLVYLYSKYVSIVGREESL